MGALSLRIFSFPGLRGRPLSPERVCITASGPYPVSSRGLSRRLVASVAYRVQTACSGGTANCPLVRLLSTNRYRIPV